MRTTIATLSILALASVGMLVTSATAAPGLAAADGLEGSWRGNGYIKFSSGAREKVRCRARYTKQTPKVFRVVATCASPSAKVTQTGTLSKVRGNRYVGDFYSPEFDVSGRVKISVSGSSQRVTLTSSSGSGSLSLRRR